MPAEAPVIGLSAYATPASWGVWSGVEAVLLPQSYPDRIREAGGIPVLLPALPGVIEAVLPRLDALLLTGGPDVEPSRYGQQPGADTQPPSRPRDEAELGLLAAAFAAGLPVLGICRGLQLINVARGGSLLQHLPGVVGTELHAPEPSVYGAHPVKVADGSRLATVLGRTAVDTVPSYHHQGVDRLGSGLVASAWAEDGTIEALEDPEAPFVVAVQWHPEVGDDPSLFTGLVEAARAATARRAGRGRRAADRPLPGAGS